MGKKTSAKIFAETVVALPVPGSFHYQVPEHLAPSLEVGSGLIVPFRSRLVSAFVLEIPSRPPEGLKGIREVEGLLAPEPFFGDIQLKLYRFISDYYLVPLGEVLRTILPPGVLRVGRRVVRITEAGREALNSAVISEEESRVLGELAGGRIEGVPEPSLMKKLPDAKRKTLNRLQKDGLISRVFELPQAASRPKYQTCYRRRKEHDESPASVLLARAPKRREVHRHLGRIHAPATSGEIQAALGFPAAPHLRALVKDGLAETVKVEVFRVHRARPEGQAPERLTREQESACRKIAASMDEGGFQTFLLHGVTGSGKTEVYLRMAQKALDMGRRVLVLVPEIALTPQLLGRFIGRLGEIVHPSHSGLSGPQRYDLWRRVRLGQIRVVVGARSALFVPLDDLGLIVVDEEHDASYKQDEGLPYNARDLAVYLARLVSCPVVLGSATPSLESYHAAKEGRYRLLEMPHRVHLAPLPPVRIVDLRLKSASASGPDRGAGRIFSPLLAQALKRCVEAGEQSILLLNRRGFSTHIFCLVCGNPVFCPNCEICLTYHKDRHEAICHFCNFSQPPPDSCGTCGNARIFFAGFGTEQVESALAEMIPKARIVRLDRDTVKKRGGHEKILSAFRRRDYDILLGTQMVAKGHDFPHVTLVGIISADTSLNFPDFRAGERTFQLLTQVAGRAGRDAKSGRIIIQSYNPNHYAVRCATGHDFGAFFSEEIERRRRASYPPFARLALLRVTGLDQDRVFSAARSLAQWAKRGAAELGLPEDCVLGPARSPLSRLKNRYRYQVLIKAPDAGQVRRVAYRCRMGADKYWPAGVELRIDIDPQNVL